MNFIAETFEPKIILFSRNVSSHNTDRIFSEHWIIVTCSVWSFISHDQQSDECTCRRMFLPSRNIYKCKQLFIVYCTFFVYVRSGRIVIAIYPLFFLYCTLLLVIYFLIPFIFIYCILLLLVYFFVPLFFLYWRCCNILFIS